MSYTTEINGWDKFWEKRDGLTKKGKKPFLRNFEVFSNLIEQYFGTSRWDGMNTCEVGAGRGTISDILNVRGCETHCCDIIDNLRHSNHYYEECNILYDTPFTKTQFDIVFTYGLLEHFTEEQRWASMMRMEDMLKPGGMFFHYVVPKKWTNVFEDRSVPRYDVPEWRFDTNHDMVGVKYVFPVWGKRIVWECDEFWSKGFIIYKRRNSENPSFSDSQIEVEQDRVQE